MDLNIFKAIVARLEQILAMINKQPTYKWGTIHSVTPPRVQFEGFDEPLVEVSTKLIPITVGDVVFCVTQNRKVTIIGKAV